MRIVLGVFGCILAIFGLVFAAVLISDWVTGKDPDTSASIGLFVLSVGAIVGGAVMARRGLFRR